MVNLEQGILQVVDIARDFLPEVAVLEVDLGAGRGIEVLSLIHIISTFYFLLYIQFNILIRKPLLGKIVFNST